MINKTMYGISIKPGDQYSAKVYSFEDAETAKKWLNTEEYDFREREISEDPEYIWDEYADYLPSRDEMESLDDIANSYSDLKKNEP